MTVNQTVAWMRMLCAVNCAVATVSFKNRRKQHHISCFLSMQFFNLKKKKLYFFFLNFSHRVPSYSLQLKCPWRQKPQSFSWANGLERWVFSHALTTLGQFSAGPGNSLLSCQRCCELWPGSWVFSVIILFTFHEPHKTMDGPKCSQFLEGRKN